MKDSTKVHILFGARVALWIISAAVTIHWIYYSFHLYNMGIYDVHEYASNMRPVLYRGLIVAFICIVISFKLRSVSDKIKKREGDKEIIVERQDMI